MTTQNQSQPPAAGEAAHTVPNGMARKSLLTVLHSVADSLNAVRLCDAWRLYETAESAGCLVQMKEYAKAKRPAVYEAMQQYEAEQMSNRAMS